MIKALSVWCPRTRIGQNRNRNSVPCREAQGIHDHWSIDYDWSARCDPSVVDRRRTLCRTSNCTRGHRGSEALDYTCKIHAIILLWTVDVYLPIISREIFCNHSLKAFVLLTQSHFTFTVNLFNSISINVKEANGYKILICQFYHQYIRPLKYIIYYIFILCVQ